MAGAHGTEPIKLGVLMDYAMPNSDIRDDFVQPIELVFKDGLESGMIDRPVELVHREVDGLPERHGQRRDRRVRRARRRGLPRGDRAEHQRQRRCRPRGDRAAVPGPGDQRLRLRGLARRVDVPAEQRLHDRRADPVGPPDGEGRPEDRGHARGALVHRAVVPAELPPRRATRGHPDRGRGVHRPDRPGHRGRRPDAARRAAPKRSCTAGSGSASRRSTTRCARSIGTRPGTWGPLWRRASTQRIWDAFVGWIGLEQYDEGNPVATEFLDRFEAAYGRRPEYFNPVLWCDVATSFLHAFADATPLSPRGCPGRARAGEDAARGVRVRRDAHLLREVEPPRLDGSGLPRRALPRPERQGGGEAVEVHPGRSVRPGLKVTG